MSDPDLAAAIHGIAEELDRLNKSINRLATIQEKRLEIEEARELRRNRKRERKNWRKLRE